ncbi:hypothetical protein INS49_009143 [Diaporthe citri]|uniref:uncharacterized protein n=1 Tax=Diaporthe citri TaxID=83186 RepID=UPI001C7EBE95|nr:uncharacterized protein INS49_009143 [Diaporthe citri]KAG6364040.1 hypothetical protein INS49_009143 [Diaporthe citri]
MAFPTPTATKLIAASRKESSHYTLVKLPEFESSEASNVFLGGDGSVPPKIAALDVAKVGTEPVSVLVITSRGPFSGTVLPDVASLRLRGSELFQTVHAVILSDSIEPGDHGSAGDNGRRKDDVKQNRLPATELKKWTKEITVTPLYARVMQAESDSESDYDNDVDDTDEEPEDEPSSATSMSAMTDQQANLEVENEKLRHQNQEMKREMRVLEGDIDVLMEDREELKQELEHLRRRLREQEEPVLG